MRRIVLLIAIFLLGNLCFAQKSAVAGLTSESSMMSESIKASTSIDQALKSDNIIAEEEIDPKTYYLGVGDVLYVQIMNVESMEQPITVNPEKKLLLPRLGEFSVKGLTLAQATDSVIARYKTRQPNIQVFVGLKKPRMIYVTLRGNVQNAGLYSAYSSYRVSTMLKLSSVSRSDQVTSMEMQNAAVKKQNDINYERRNIKSIFYGLPSYSVRNIVILHNDGTRQNVDLVKALYGGDKESNPNLREGDEIFVPYEIEKIPTISIGGAVKKEATIAYKEGDSLSTLIKASLGFLENADMDNISAVLPISDKIIKISNIIISNTGADLGANNIALEPGSVVNIGYKAIGTFDNFGVVKIEGCVKNPGSYLIRKDKSRLKELVEKAGGITEKALLNGSVIYRKDIDYMAMSDVKLNTLKEFQYSDLTLQDTVRYNMDQNLKMPIVSCDFKKALLHNDEKENVILQDGDYIYIPENRKIVFVYGMVQKPGYVEFAENKNMEWYIERAGGVTTGGVHKRARIIKAGNKTWMQGEDDIALESGDNIYIPRKPDTSPEYEMQVYGTIISVCMSLVSVISTFYYMSKKS